MNDNNHLPIFINIIFSIINYIYIYKTLFFVDDIGYLQSQYFDVSSTKILDAWAYCSAQCLNFLAMRSSKEYIMNRDKE